MVGPPVMTVPLRSARLLLRTYDADDAAFVRDLYSREAVQRFLGNGTARTTTLEAAREKIAGWQAAWDTDPVLGVWAVCEPDGSPLGTVLLKPIPDSGTDTAHDVEVGWHLHPDAWGRGWATEAARTVLDHAFTAGLDRVVAVTHPDNTASQAVCRRLGMTHRGRTRAYYDAECELFELAAENPDLVVGEDGLARPLWAAGDPLLREYYDHEWGMPVREEVGLYERIVLEGFQSGLSWRTVLAKRPAFREVFHDFDPDAVAAMGEADVQRLMGDVRIIRNERKIRAAVTNARATVALREQEGLVDLVWSFRPEETPEPVRFAEVPTVSERSTALSKELKRRGFAFVGPTTMYALMEAIGMVDTHLVGSHRRGSSGEWT